MDYGESGEITTLQVVTIYRPTRVVAAVCCFIVTLLIIISLGPTEWVETMETAGSAIKNKEGLFRICPEIVEGRLSALPEGVTCRDQDKAYMKGVAALIFISWILTLAAGGLLTFGMLTHLDNLKMLLYRVALVLSIITGVMLLIALITFPIMVSQGLQATITQAEWSVGWPYMLDWASLVVVVIIIILLVLDRSPDETSVQEKVVRS